MSTEAESLIEALKRLDASKVIWELEVTYHEDGSGDISYFAPDRLGYYPTFKFNKNGELIHAGVTI